MQADWLVSTQGATGKCYGMQLGVATGRHFGAWIVEKAAGIGSDDQFLFWLPQ